MTVPANPDTVMFDGYGLDAALSLIVIAAVFEKFPGVHAGVPVKVAVGVDVAVAVAVFVAVFVGVFVAVNVGVGDAVAVDVGVPVAHGNVMLSIRTPTVPAATAPMSVASRHLSRMFWPFADAGRLTVVVMYAGAAVVPADSPLHAWRPAIGLPSDELMVRLYPPTTHVPPAVIISAKAAPLTLISSTMPSNPVVAFWTSRLKRLRKLNCPPPAGIEILGEISSLLLAVVISEPNASFGAESDVVVEVTHAGNVPVVTTDDQPTGSAGAETLSKF